MNNLDSVETTIHRIDHWIDSHVDHFDPLSWTTDAKRYLRCKAFLEASLYLYVTETVQDSPPQELRRLVISRVNDPRYHGYLRREPGQLLKYAYPFAYAKHVGELDPTSETVLAVALAEPSVLATERPPHRMMDLWHFCQMYGIEPPGPDVSTILELSSLANLPDPVAATDEDVYGLTHNVMFYHNFGSQSSNFPNSPSPYDTETVLTALLLRYLAAENYDIATELLLSGVLERCLPPKVVQFAVERITAAMDEYGVVPGPKTAEYLAETDAPDPAREWELNYHTMAVVGMTFRVLRLKWSNFVLDPHRPEAGVSDRDTDLMMALGGLIQALAEYDLETASGHLEDLPRDSTMPAVLSFAIEFLRRHRRSDGTYGYWPDEESVYTTLGRTSEDFYEELIYPMSVRLDRAISGLGIEDAVGAVSHEYLDAT